MELALRMGAHYLGEGFPNVPSSMLCIIIEVLTGVEKIYNCQSDY